MYRLPSERDRLSALRVSAVGARLADGPSPLASHSKARRTCAATRIGPPGPKAFRTAAREVTAAGAHASGATRRGRSPPTALSRRQPGGRATRGGEGAHAAGIRAASAAPPSGTLHRQPVRRLSRARVVPRDEIGRAHV